MDKEDKEKLDKDKDKDGYIDEQDLKSVREGLKRGGKGNIAKRYPGSKAASDARQTLSGMTIPEDTGRNGKNAGGKVKKKGMAGGGMTKKKGMAGGGMTKKKGMANGGMTKKKGMAGGGIAKKKKGYATGGMKKKGYSKGGAAGGKRKGKVRGVRIASKGFRPAKMVKMKGS